MLLVVTGRALELLQYPVRVILIQFVTATSADAIATVRNEFDDVAESLLAKRAAQSFVHLC